jgi:hypothetical protein
MTDDFLEPRGGPLRLRRRKCALGRRPPRVVGPEDDDQAAIDLLECFERKVGDVLAAPGQTDGIDELHSANSFRPGQTFTLLKTLRDP